MGMGLKIENMSPEFIERNRAVLEAAGFKIPPPDALAPLPAPDADRPIPAIQMPVFPKPSDEGTSTSSKVRKYSKGSEFKLQKECEKEMKRRGYVFLDNENAAQNATTAKYWFGHLARPQGNPFMPDLFLFGNRMRNCLMVELKTLHKFTVGQQEMIEAGNWVLATSFKEFCEILDGWEKILLLGTGTGARE